MSDGVGKLPDPTPGKVMDEIQPAWQSVFNSFNDVPNAKRMTYMQHVGHLLWADAHVLVLGFGMLMHTVFPQVCGQAEPMLIRFLNDRAESAIQMVDLALQTDDDNQ